MFVSFLALLTVGCVATAPKGHSDDTGHDLDGSDDSAVDDSGTNDSDDDTGSLDTSETGDTAIGETDTVEECPYTLLLSDTTPYGPICSGDLEETSSLVPGDLFQTDGANTWYYTGDSRAVVGHGSVYESWWGADVCSCAQVKVVSQDVASSIVMVNNLTIKPGSFIVKINSDPSLYVIEAPYTVRKTDEGVLTEIYGDQWGELVRTIPDMFFVDYAMGPDVLSVADYDLAASATTTIDSIIAAH